MRKKIAIITGASSGMGAEFAKQVDEKFILDEIWLVARRKKRLEETAIKIKKAKPIIIQVDLTKEIEKITSRIEKENPNIKLLVNNAGFGKVGNFLELPLEIQLEMIDLNIKALVTLTYKSARYIEENSSIIQVASVAGYGPLSKFNVYSATKAFVLNFANSLNEELKKKKIHVLAVCPGPVKTEFFKIAQGKQEEKGVNPQKVVSKALKDLKKKKWSSTYSLKMKFLIILMKIMPRKWIVKLTK